MPDIQQYLNSIKQAIYGEQVRGSIHDAIEAINKVAEAASAAAIDARNSATKKAEEAANSATEAETAKDTATQKAKEAKESAESVATAKDTLSSLSGALVPQGTITFSQLSSKAKTIGHLWNISDSFTSTTDFEDGGSKQYPAGSNVYTTANLKWDVLAGNNVIQSVNELPTKLSQLENDSGITISTSTTTTDESGVVALELSPQSSAILGAFSSNGFPKVVVTSKQPPDDQENVWGFQLWEKDPSVSEGNELLVSSEVTLTYCYITSVQE